VIPTIRLCGLAAVAACLGCAGSARPTPTPTPDARTSLRLAIDSMVSQPQWRNAHWGILVVDPARGDTLYSRNAGKLFMPASNMKVITGAVALQQLGADYRYRTTVAARRTGTGPLVQGGVLRGDLVVIGRGDPTVSDHMRGDAMAPMREMADSLARLGVRRVAGRLVADGSAIQGPELGWGWAWDDLDYPYSAGVSGLYLNEGFTRVVVVAGARPGDRAAVRTAPLASLPAVISNVTTVARPAGDARLEEPALVRDSTSGSIVVTGAVAAGDSVVLDITYADQQAAYLAALEYALRGRGIVVAGGLDAHPDGGAVPVTDTLFTMLSPSLREIMPALQKPSQNQIAELLLKTLGLEKTGVGSADSGRRVVERQLAAWGADTAGFVIRDGSGLSRHDYLSPETLVRVFAAIQSHPDFMLFYDALPIAGVDGTIRGRMKTGAAYNNVRAKTGFIDRARSLSGYVTTADGHRLIFSMLANNWTLPTRAVEQVQDAVAQRLASLSLQ
jgi:D-alanyl-D-alanine carboxypeptidase/D-alanyl-D-alanine-endopeptidase (penicillin-binding protein 4)